MVDDFALNPASICHVLMSLTPSIIYTCHSKNYQRKLHEPDHFSLHSGHYFSCSLFRLGTRAGRAIGRGCGAEGADQLGILRRGICADRHKQIHDRHVSAHYALISIPNLLSTYCK
jgi:hypothetical protein